MNIDKISIVNEYKLGKNYKFLTKKYKISSKTLVKWVKELYPEKIKFCKYFTNYNFFSNPNNWGEKQAYFLGLLYTDGCNTKNTICISLKNEDKYILDILKDCLEYNGKFCNHISNNYTGLKICNRELSKILNDLGLVPRKTFKVKFPYFIKTDLLSHFIRGVIDGDGCIGVYKNNRINLNLCGYKPFVISIFKYLSDNLDVKFSISNTKNPEIVSVNIYGRNQCKIVLDYIYKDSTVFLKRKFEKFKQIKGEL